MPYCGQNDPALSSTSSLAESLKEEISMDHETETELVTETLVEEVSIDGMCGVY